jgi:hypothetical protein
VEFERRHCHIVPASLKVNIVSRRRVSDNEAPPSLYRNIIKLINERASKFSVDDGLILIDLH